MAGAPEKSRRLQVGLASSGKPPVRAELAKLRLARVLGAHSFFLPDHLRTNLPPQPPGEAPRWIPARDAFLEPTVLLGAMAARSRRIRLGIGVTDGLRRHPAALAQAIVTLDHVSGGRAILGLGAGSRENLEPYGLAHDAGAARLEETLEILRRLWASDGRPVDFEGPAWRLAGALLATPLHRGRAPSVWLGVHRRELLRLAGRFADGWYPTIKTDPDGYARKLAIVRAAAGGRSLDRFEPALQAFLVLGPGRDRLLGELASSGRAASFALAIPASRWRKHGLRHPLGERRGFSDFAAGEVTPGVLEAARTAATPELLAEGLFAGTPGEVWRELRPFVAAGLRHVVLANVGPGWRGARVDDLVRLAVLVRRLRRIELPS